MEGDGSNVMGGFVVGRTGGVRRCGGKVGVNGDPVKYDGLEWCEGCGVFDGSCSPNGQRLSRMKVAMLSSSFLASLRCVSMRRQLSKQEPRR